MACEELQSSALGNSFANGCKIPAWSVFGNHDMMVLIFVSFPWFEEGKNEGRSA
jgi:hypothetical protein